MKCNTVDDKFVSLIWSQEEILWSCSYAYGKFVGMLSLWKSCEIFPIFSFSGVRYLGVKLVWKGRLYYILNVYSPCNISLKRVLWKKILVLINKYMDGDWIMGVISMLL